jgi:hypothetical protein
MLMADSKETRDKQIPFQRHPLYEEAMKQMAEGDAVAAAVTLKRLAELYPEEQAIRDLLLRVQLRTTFGTTDYIQVDHSPAAPGLRNMVLVLMAITACLVIITGMTAAYRRWYLPTVVAEQHEEYINSLWAEVGRLLEVGDLSGAREKLAEVERERPNDPRILELRASLEHGEACANLYADIVAARERGEWQATLDLLHQLPSDCPEYAQAQQLVGVVQEQIDLETAWQQAQAQRQAEDWEGTISTLTALRTRNPEFHRAEVEEQLYQAYVVLAQRLISQANGNVDSLRQAAGYLNDALALRPTNPDLIAQKRLAEGFVAGAEAYRQGNMTAAVAAWEPAYALQPDYQNGVLKRDLYKAYPLAAKQLIDQADGSVRWLTQAATYLDQALAVDPNNPELLDERHRLEAYLAGQEALSKEQWDLAISYWAPIYATYPDYQDGLLEENLRLACANSTASDKTMCPP